MSAWCRVRTLRTNKNTFHLIKYRYCACAKSPKFHCAAFYIFSQMSQKHNNGTILMLNLAKMGFRKHIQGGMVTTPNDTTLLSISNRVI